MQTFHEFLAKKAMVLPNLFRIEPFIGLAQPIPLKPTIKRTVKPGRRLGGVMAGITCKVSERPALPGSEMRRAFADKR